MKKYLEPIMEVIAFDVTDPVSFGDGPSVPFTPNSFADEYDDIWNGNDDFCDEHH